MKKKYSILIIDDHPLIVEAYRNALKVIESGSDQYSFGVDSSSNCADAISKIEFASVGMGYDLIILDIKLPPSEDLKILSGEDLGLKINDMLPDCKIIVSTTFNDNFRANNILMNLNPDGYLVKNDINPQDLIYAIKSVIADVPYYSKTIMRLLKTRVSNVITLDKIDRQLLYSLSLGTKMKDMPCEIPLSMAAIEKRKRVLKDIFEVETKADKDLISAAKEKGFI